MMGVDIRGGVMLWINMNRRGKYPLKDARPWLDSCTARVRAPAAKTKRAVERKG